MRRFFPGCYCSVSANCVRLTSETARQRLQEKIDIPSPPEFSENRCCRRRIVVLQYLTVEFMRSGKIQLPSLLAIYQQWDGRVVPAHREKRSRNWQRNKCSNLFVEPATKDERDATNGAVIPSMEETESESRSTRRRISKLFQYKFFNKKTIHVVYDAKKHLDHHEENIR